MTTQHFIATKTEANKKYTLTLFEVVKKGKINRIGETTAYYGSHKGEVSEAYTGVKKTGLIKASILKAITSAQKERGCSGNYEQYYYQSFADNFGLKIEVL